MPSALPEPDPWRTPTDELIVALDTTRDGLTSATAQTRLAVIGPNAAAPLHERPALLQFLQHFRNPLVLLLLAASAVSAFLGDTRSFVVIGLIVLMSVTLDFVQEFRANRAAARLRATVAVRASVRRDGRLVDVAMHALVPGDVVQLAAGDLVPADARVLEARDCFVNQALLTGESYPVEKHVASGADDDPVAANALMMGTSVVSGSATALVVRTGAQTAVAALADSLAARPPATAFERGTQAFGVLILRLTLGLVLFVLLVNAALGRALFDSLLFAVALAVGLTPELLPMVVSVTLSRGALRLTRQRVIVKRLSAVQDLGAMDTLCTDKTGTLTAGRIELERHVDPQGQDSARVLELAWVNSHFETGIRSPLDDAILRHRQFDASPWRKLDEVPFDFERRRVSVLVEREDQRLLVVKGAPEDVLRLCAFSEPTSGQPPEVLDPATLQRIDALQEDLGRAGFRVLGVAWRAVPSDHDHAVLDDERALVFAGFCAFLDPPKASAASALKALAANGIAVKVVTGDTELVTRHVFGELGIVVDGVLNGHDIAALDDDALRAQVTRCNLFCRVTPTQKTRVLQALRARGHVVGFLGDGINDAPSLHAADVGISVDGAVDIAKEAADLILLEPDLSVLQHGVHEGRRTFANVMKYIMMGTSSNFGNMFSMAGGVLLLPFLPLLPIQILLNNFLYDLSEIAIPFDRVEEEMLARPQRWDMDFVRSFMLALGPVSSLFDFLTFYILRVGFAAKETLFHTGWFVESIATQVLVIFIIRTRGSPLARPPHPALVVLSLTVVCVAALLPVTALGRYVGFEAPPPAFYLVLAGVVAAYLAVVQCVKVAFYKRWHRRHPVA